jgi:hypothetical protein
MDYLISTLRIEGTPFPEFDSFPTGRAGGLSEMSPKDCATSPSDRPAGPGGSLFAHE